MRSKVKELIEFWIQLPGKWIENIDLSLTLQPVMVFRMYKRLPRTTGGEWLPTVLITSCILTFMYEPLDYRYFRLRKFVSWPCWAFKLLTEFIARIYTVNPIAGRGRPWGFQEVEAPRFQDMKVVSLSALRTGRLYPPPPLFPGNIPGIHFY
jgi:hypothetical protein